jgi:dipeptidyl aminopeptidase/acylaminoacyl peptidase
MLAFRCSALTLVALTAALLAVPAAGRGQTRPAQGRPAASRAGQLPPIIPITHFFDNPEITGAQISPDGRWLSYLKPYKGKLNIYVRRLGATIPAGGIGRAAGERLMTTDTARAVQAYFWSADAKYLLYAQDKGGNENFHVYAVPLAGTGTPPARDLTPYEGVRAQIFAAPRDLPDRVLVGMNKRSQSAFDAYWLNLATGDTTLVAQNPGRHLGYLLDNNNAVRVAVGQNEQGGTDIFARTTERDPWRTVARYPATDQAGPLRVHPNGRQVYLVSNAGDSVNLARLVLLDLETGAVTAVESDPEREVDFGGALFSEVTDSLLATVYVADTARIYPKTPQIERDVARIKRLHDGQPLLGSQTNDETKWVVSFNSPTDPGVTYLYDRTTGRAQFLFRPRPWLRPSQLAGMRPVSYKSRDGLTVHGYLTLPVGVAARNLPLILLVHGGPWARDQWGYQPEAQLLANRGYAVLQINYRGSTGYGKEFYNAAVKEWAGKMHTDLIDGVEWAISDGIADRAKVAIYGGSYGGYATLVGLTFTPEVFACGVDYVGPSSLITLIESFPAYWKPFLEGTFYRHVGNPTVEADREELRKRSPLFFVDRIQDPLLIVQGANDPRVTKREADQIAIALRDRGVKVQYLVAPNEGHGFLNPDNRLALYRSMELFFRDCLGGRAQQTVAPEIQRHIAQLTVNVDTLKLQTASEPVRVMVGDAAVAGARLTPSTTTRRFILVQGGQEREAGTVRDEITAIDVNGQPALRRVQVITSPLIGMRTDTVVVLRSTHAPVSNRSQDQRRTLSLDFRRDSVIGSMTPAGATAQSIAVRSDTALFDVAAIDLTLRVLPLADGYAVKLPVYVHEGGGKVWMTARVTGSERVAGEGGAMVDTWKVEGDIGPQKVTSWIAKDSRAILKTEIAAGPGVILRVVR